MDGHSNSFDAILPLCPLRSGAFIVTVFGDVVLPGDGQMWIGHLIDLCADLGISETLVRTSVSRLVASGQLVGTRRGRRSFYALSAGARAEFNHAAQIIYTAPQDRPWRFLFFPAGHSPDTLDQLDMAAFTAQLAFGPARGAVPEGAVAFTAHADGAHSDLAAMLSKTYPLEDLAEAYRAFCTLERAIAALPITSAKTALQARLVLTHAWRRIALRAPRLPAHLLPEDYPESTARAAFGRSYLALTPLAEQVEADFLSIDSSQLSERLRILAERCAALDRLAQK